MILRFSGIALNCLTLDINGYVVTGFRCAEQKSDEWKITKSRFGFFP